MRFPGRVFHILLFIELQLRQTDGLEYALMTSPEDTFNVIKARLLSRQMKFHKTFYSLRICFLGNVHDKLPQH